MSERVYTAVNGLAIVRADGDVCDAVEERLRELLRSADVRLGHRKGDCLYGGFRTQPDQLGWRVIQRLRIAYQQAHGIDAVAPLPDVEAIRRGDHDEDIVETFHEAARAEHWYAYEKDWGEP